jgi:hypothetical protein
MDITDGHASCVHERNLTVTLHNHLQAVILITNSHRGEGFLILNSLHLVTAKIRDET